MKIVSLALPVFAVVHCDFWPTPNGDEATPIVVLQITESRDPEAFDRIMAELEARGIKCALLFNADIAEQRCERIQELADAGYEIMAFARPESPTGESLTMSMLSYEEQEELMTGLKTAIENCLEGSVLGFRCTRFDQNEDTCTIVDALGFEYNLGFVARTDCSLPGHENDTLPYQVLDYGFWAVPMHSVYYDESWKAFCDNPFRDLEAGDWEALLKSELDRMTDEEHPLLVEFHPYFTGTDEGRFEAFVNFLDYALEQGAQFMTVAELVDWTEQQAAEDNSCPCEE